MDNNISPLPTSRISPSTSDEDKNSADPRKRKPVKTQPLPHKSPAPPEIEVAERDEAHKLDERA
jgi:hypothetical protein